MAFSKALRVSSWRGRICLLIASRTCPVQVNCFASSQPVEEYDYSEPRSPTTSFAEHCHGLRPGGRGVRLCFIYATRGAPTAEGSDGEIAISIIPADRPAVKHGWRFRRGGDVAPGIFLSQPMALDRRRFAPGRQFQSSPQSLAQTRLYFIPSVPIEMHRHGDGAKPEASFAVLMIDRCRARVSGSGYTAIVLYR